MRFWICKTGVPRSGPAEWFHINPYNNLLPGSHIVPCFISFHLQEGESEPYSVWFAFPRNKKKDSSIRQCMGMDEGRLKRSHRVFHVLPFTLFLSHVTNCLWSSANLWLSTHPSHPHPQAFMSLCPHDCHSYVLLSRRIDNPTYIPRTRLPSSYKTFISLRFHSPILSSAEQTNSLQQSPYGHLTIIRLSSCIGNSVLSFTRHMGWSKEKWDGNGPSSDRSLQSGVPSRSFHNGMQPLPSRQRNSDPGSSHADPPVNKEHIFVNGDGDWWTRWWNIVMRILGADFEIYV